MERFREHEKEFKMKQYSKRALQADYEKQGNFVDGSDDNSDYNSNYGSELSATNSDEDQEESLEEDEEYERIRKESIVEEDDEDNM